MSLLAEKYKKKSVNKIKFQKPIKQQTINVEPFDFDDNFDPISDIQMKSSRQLRKEKSQAKYRKKISGKKPPKKKMAKDSDYNYNINKSTEFKIINGKKNESKIKAMFSLLISVIIILSLVAMNYLSPTGIVETIQNSYALMGDGILPRTLEGNNFYNMVSENGNINIISDTYYESYNSSGKQLVVSQHGFANPEIEVSAARTLVFDRGGTGAKIYNYTGLIFNKNLDNTIYSADIARNGTCAFVTSSRGYAAQVDVVDKNFNSVFTWYSSDNLLSDVAISENGKRIAVCELFAKDGSYMSRVSVFNYNDAVAEFSFEFQNVAITSLQSFGNDSFLAISDGAISLINWDKAVKNDIDFDGSVKAFNSHNDEKFAFVHGRINNSISNDISIFDDSGKIINNFSVNAVIKDIALCDDVIYCLTENTILCFTLDGKLANTIDCGYNALLVSDIGNNMVATISQSELTTYNYN